MILGMYICLVLVYKRLSLTSKSDSRKASSVLLYYSLKGSHGMLFKEEEKKKGIKTRKKGRKKRKRKKRREKERYKKKTCSHDASTLKRGSENGKNKHRKWK